MKPLQIQTFLDSEIPLFRCNIGRLELLKFTRVGELSILFTLTPEDRSLQTYLEF